MLTRSALLLIGFGMAAQAAAEEMSFEQSHHFVIGKLFEVSCFDGTRAMGRIYSDGSVIGTVQFRATVKVKGEAVCASLEGLPLEPCFKFNRTGDHTFRASVWGFNTAYCDFTPLLDSETDFARTDGRSTDGPLRLNPCTAGVQEQC